MSKPVFREGALLFSFDDGVLTIRDTQTGTTTRGRMAQLRREFYTTGALPPEFQSRIAQQLLGVWGAERPAETARIDTKRQGSFRD